MALDVNDVMRVVLEWDTPAENLAQLVFHYKGVSGSSVDPSTWLVAMIAKITSGWNDIKANISDEYTSSFATVYQWDFTNHQWDGVATATVAGMDGTSVTEGEPHGVAGLFKFGTELTRRQGRKYVMGFDEATVADGFFTAATLVNMALCATDWDDNVVGGGLTTKPCTFNVNPTSALYETASLYNAANVISSIPAYQRRRRPGTGI